MPHPTLRRLAFAALLVAWPSAYAGKPPPAAAEPPPPLPPEHKRPAVVVETLMRHGLLTPSAQEVAKATVFALIARYGQDFVCLEDEAISTRKLRRMSAGMGSLVPPDAEKTQKARLALLEWAIAEAPFRVRVEFKADRKAGGYSAAVECRKRGDTTLIHRVEGHGKTYDSAVEDLRPHLKSFCGALDGVLVERNRKRAGGP